MSEGTSVGVISLDLVIKNTIEGQLDKIKSGIKSSFSKPHEEAGKTAQQALTKPLEEVSKVGEKVAEGIQKSMETATENAAETVKKQAELINRLAIRESTKSTHQDSGEVKQPQTIKMTGKEFDSRNITDEVAEIEEQIKNSSKKSSDIAAQAVERVSESFRASAEPLELLNQKLSLQYAALDKINTVALPMITQFRTQIWTTLGTLFDFVKTVFDTLWSGVVSPVLGFVAKAWCDLMELLSEFWNKWGVPIFDGIREVINNIKDLFVKAWEGC